MNLSDLIERNAAFAPEKPALRFEGETLSYAAFHARIVQAACALETEFGVQFDPERMANLTSVRRLQAELESLGVRD